VGYAARRNPILPQTEEIMMGTRKDVKKDWVGYYNQENILNEITEEPVAFSLNETLLQDIAAGKRKRPLKNISIKMDPLHVQAIKKLAAMKSIPYQTLMRHWLAEEIRKELDAITR
jgi:predicted DNA binding CopG/RHH family protein